MSPHALFSPSSAHRWMECPGSFAFPANTTDTGSSIYADDGTASHEWAAKALLERKSADEYIGEEKVINGRTFIMDEDRAANVQEYLDAVSLMRLGGILLVEHRVDLSRWLGPNQGGTADAVILFPDEVIVIDFKYGKGERVEAVYTQAGRRKPNHQLALYAAGALADAELFGFKPTRCRLVISQPRIGNFSSEVFRVEDIIEHAVQARSASELAGKALILAPDSLEVQMLMRPGESQCRWCRGKATCPALTAQIKTDIRAEFDEEPAMPNLNPVALGLAMRSVPLIEIWCKAVRDETAAAVERGDKIVGSDGLPMKFVEGRMGNSAYVDTEAAETTLVGLLGEAAYEPRTIISASEARKRFDKAKTRATYTDVIAPLIHRPPGKPVLALGSDERAPYSGPVDFKE